jgi:cysteine desulfurase / selenocysteine lyase
MNFADFGPLFIGSSTQVPVLDGSLRRYINLDNAASTPSLRAVLDAINNYMPYYSSVHRGTGFKSQLSTRLYEQSRTIVMEFVGASPQTHTCLFGKNTTEAINKLARRMPFSAEKNIVLTSGLEHHSNDLPWRAVANTIHIGLTPDGQLDEADFDRQLRKYAGRVAMVSISGASNVTGFISPVHRLAEKAHAAGAQILVDCAQLAPHRKIDMLGLDDPAHLDYVAISAHKMYAPFGTGALVGRRDTFERGDPDQRGGGTVELVTLEEVVWADPPDREEAGSPNTVGAIALAAAILQLRSIGMDKVAAHEAALTSDALIKLRSLKEVTIFGDADPENADQRVGVIPFNLNGFSHFKVAAILGYEFGIGVRNGCFCAHPYILHLLGLSQNEANRVREDMLDHNRSDMPGLIRMSFGLSNTTSDTDELVEALEKIIHGEITGSYRQDIATGEFHPVGWKPDFNAFSL